VGHLWMGKNNLVSIGYYLNLLSKPEKFLLELGLK
jgi:hypothetical protein